MKNIIKSINKWELFIKEIKEEELESSNFYRKYWVSCGFCEKYMINIDGNFSCDACPLNTHIMYNNEWIPYCDNSANQKSFVQCILQKTYNLTEETKKGIILMTEILITKMTEILEKEKENGRKN